MNFIVLSSSRGTTFQAIIDRIADGSLTATCLGLITDRDDRECTLKAKSASISYAIVDTDPKQNREAFDREVDAAIRALANEQDVLIAEMGWMWIHNPWFIKKWRGRILNVHPALLPKYGGKGMYGDHVHEAVLAAGETESGVTIHLIDEGVDTGTILVQKKCSLDEEETVDSLKNKVQGLEKEWYPKTLQMIQNGELKIA